jgi:hypothetical protein
MKSRSKISLSQAKARCTSLRSASGVMDDARLVFMATNKHLPGPLMRQHAPLGVLLPQ